MGHLTEACQTLTTAWDLLGLDVTVADPPDQPDQADRWQLGARVLLCLSFPTAYLGRLEDGLAVLDSANQLLAHAPHDGLAGSLASQRGLLLIDAGRPEEGLRQLDRAVTLAANATVDTQVRTYMNRGETNQQLGDLTASENDLRRAVDLATEHGLVELGMQATHNLGQVRSLAGDLPGALDLMPLVSEVPTAYERGVVGVDRARVLLAAGLLEEADRSLVAAIEALETTEYTQELGLAELVRAQTALLTANFERAALLSSRAAARLTASGNARQALTAAVVSLQTEAALGVAAQATADHAQQLAGQLSATGLRDESRQARLIAAQAVLSGAVGPDSQSVRPRAGEPIHLRLQLRLIRAREAYARGDRRRGRRIARLGLSELARHQESFGSLDLQTASAAHGVDLAALAVAEEIVADRPAAVLDWLERVRLISGRVPQVRPPADDELADALSRLRWVVSRLEGEDTGAQEIDGLRTQRAALEGQIRNRHRTHRGGGPRSSATPDLRRVRDRLGEADLAAVFWLHDDLYAIVLGRRGCRLTPLGRLADAERQARRVAADLDLLAHDRIPDAVRSAAGSSLRTGLATIDRQLLAPLRLRDRPLVLLPPAKLAGLPWNALPSLHARPVTVAPSARAWLTATDQLDRVDASLDGHRTVLTVAGPQLERADEEAVAVATVWPAAQVLRGDQANGGAVLAALDGADLVHFAAHGQHVRDSPLFSAIRLADGPLVGYDWDRVAHPPAQVVLSACDLGQATARRGDEALGLTRALLHAGVSTVVSGVAKISDASAPDFMVDYHRRLASGAAPAYALAAALDASDETLPFVCFGAGW